MQDGPSLVRSGQLLYTNDVGSDACGIGGVASKDGKPSAEVVKRSLTALVAMEHRGGVCGKSGDGAGITLQLPQAYFRAVLGTHAPTARVTAADTLGVGVVFVVESDPAKIEAARQMVTEALRGGPVELLAIRPVPTNDDALPKAARDTKPGAIDHFVFKVAGDPAAADKWLFRRRLELRHRLTQAGLNAYVCSLSARLISYKGLLTSPQLVDFFPDLTAPGFESGITSFHRRYSTNTFPNWKLAQPFRYTCHNGEINTVRTNRNAVSAFSRALDPQLPGGDLLTPRQSDSGSH